MSPKVRYAIVGILALVMTVSLTGYAGGINAQIAAAVEMNTGSENTGKKISARDGQGMPPQSELVGIYTVELEEEPREEIAGVFEHQLSVDSTENEETEGDTLPAETEANEETGGIEAQEIEEEIIPSSAYDGIAVVTIGEAYLRVRADATTEAATIGRMYPASFGKILEEANGWYHIQSGNVDGWISADYALTGWEAEAYVKENMDAMVTVNTDVLRVRAESDTESAFLDYVKMGEVYAILAEENGWYQIEFAPGKTGYVSGEYVKVGANLADAMTLEEAEAYERRKALEEKAERLGAELRGETYATEEQVYLLAALCRHEAGVNAYEGSLAVANVVINRMRNGYWGTSMEEVIYSPGQFQYVENGVLNNYISNPGSECLQAARDALAGLNNVGGYLFFRSAKTAVYSEYSSWVDIGGNVFYAR